MRRLMAIFAHPDDEGAMGGTLARYAQNNTEIMLVCTTKGEAGEISDPSLATPETLGEVRQAELKAACQILGIQQLRFLDYRDSGMAGTPENDDPRALIQADPVEATGRLVALMRDFEPDVVVTFEPFGWYGHPDHQITSQWASRAYELAWQNGAGPDESAQRPRRLFHSVIPFSKWQAMIQEAMAAGFVEDAGFDIVDFPMEQLMATEAAVTHVVDVAGLYDLTQRAMREHRTQFSEEHMFNQIPKETRLKVAGHEYFIQVQPTPSPELAGTRLSDLFDGL